MAEESVSSGSYGSGVLPPQMLAEWKPEDYIRCIRAISNNWNFNVYQYNPNAIDLRELGLPNRFADRCFWWSEYYFGRQKNIDFNALLLSANGNRRARKLFRSKDVKKFVDDQVGALQGTLKSFPDIVDAVGVSDNVVSARKEELDLQKFLMDDKFSKQMSAMLEPFGVYIETPNGKRFASQTAEQQGAIGWVDAAQQAAANICKDFYYRNYCDEQFVEFAKYAYITGLGAAKVNVHDGYPLLEQFPSYEAIFPPLNSGDQHRTDEYAGRMRFMSLPELAATYPELGEKRLKEIEREATSETSEFYTNYNVTLNIGSSVMWWSKRDGIPRVGVADVQWASQDEKGEHVNRQGVLIGNKHLIREGIATNQTDDWRNPSHKNFDYIFCRPMSVMGQNMGIPETIYTYVNAIDMMQSQINDWIARAKGRNYVLYSKNLPEGMTSEDVVSELSENGIIVLEGVDMEAGNTQRDSLMSEINMELPASTITLIGQIQMYRGMMADILNIPNESRGQFKGYQTNKNVEAALVNSSKGTSTFSIPIYTAYERMFQKAVDKFVTATLDNPNIEYSLIVGDTAMEMFKATHNFSCSRYGIKLKLDDAADEQYRMMLEQRIFAYAQNPESGYRESDFTAIHSMGTISEITNYLRYREAQIDANRAAQAKAAQEAQAAQVAMAAQSQERQTAMREQNMNVREAAKLENSDEKFVAEMMHEKEMANSEPAG
jgi:hypothetical protein